MLTKILIFLAVVIGVFLVARLGAASARGPILRRKPRKQVEDFAPCPRCGAYRSVGSLCDCDGARR